MRVDQQHHAVDHRQRALDFTAEVGVTGRVENVDVGAFPADGTVLGQNGNAALALDGIVVHDGVDHLFMLGKSAGLAQKLIDHGGFTVVNVRNDRDVADLCTHKVSKMPRSVGRGVPSKIC